MRFSMVVIHPVSPIPTTPTVTTHTRTAATVIVSTASAAKFPEALEASGVPPEETEAVRALFAVPTHFQEMNRGQDWKGMLVDKIRRISERREREGETA